VPSIHRFDSIFTILKKNANFLLDRRKKKQLLAFYKIHNKSAASYLNDITPELRNVTTRYETRNAQNYNISLYRLQLFEKSFILSVIDVRSCDNIFNFKRMISKDIEEVPIYFSHGNMYLKCFTN